MAEFVNHLQPGMVNHALINELQPWQPLFLNVMLSSKVV